MAGEDGPITERRSHCRRTELYLDQLGKWDLLTGFWEEDRLSMADLLTVDPGDDIPVTRKDSTVIKARSTTRKDLPA